jgi:hypothetical protein
MEGKIDFKNILDDGMRMINKDPKLKDLFQKFQGEEIISKVKNTFENFDMSKGGGIGDIMKMFLEVPKNEQTEKEMNKKFKAVFLDSTSKTKLSEIEIDGKFDFYSFLGTREPESQNTNLIISEIPIHVLYNTEEKKSFKRIERLSGIPTNKVIFFMENRDLSLSDFLLTESKYVSR